MNSRHRKLVSYQDKFEAVFKRFEKCKLTEELHERGIDIFFSDQTSVSELLFPRLLTAGDTLTPSSQKENFGTAAKNKLTIWTMEIWASEV